MSHFILHTKAKEKRYLTAGIVCVLLAVAGCCALHAVGTARAKSRETVLIYTEEELEHYLLDKESEEYNLKGRYRLEADLELGWLEGSIGTNVEPFAGNFDGNGHVISGLERPLFGVLNKARVENLFLSDALILHPFTYFDGEKYVDGYGALAAYAVDSAVENCGMNGEIHMATPTEAEYQVAIASAADADEQKGPGYEAVEKTQGESHPAGGEAGVEGGPGYTTEVDDEAGTGDGGAEQGSGSETGNDSEMESSVESGSSQESGNSSESESSQKPGTGAESGGGQKPETGSESGSSQETESGLGTESSEESENSQGTETGSEAGMETESEHNTDVETGSNNEIASNSTDKKETDTSDKETEKNENSASETMEAEGVQTMALSETIGFGAMERQLLMMKVPALVDSDMELAGIASPSDAEESKIENGGPGESQSEEGQSEDKTDGVTGNQGTSGADAGPGVGSVETSGASEETGSVESQDQPEEYIGNPNGDIYLLVTAQSITAGGLTAEITGDSLISNCFALVVIGAELDDQNICTGGMAGIIRSSSRIENSYTAGLADADGTTAGFAARNEGTIQNCYSTMTVGERGIIRGAFTAAGDGRFVDCAYDYQMACVEQPALGSPDFANISDENTEGSINGLSTFQMTGAEHMVPGSWYPAEHAYPQIPYFAQSENETVISCSMASAVALELPEGTMLSDILNEADILLPTEIDGREIQWDAEGDITIDENHQLKVGLEVVMQSHDVPKVGVSLTMEESDSDNVDTETEGSAVDSTASPTSDTKLKASIGGATREFALTVGSARAAESFTSWESVALKVIADQTAGTVNPDYIPTLNPETNYYEIKTPEALSWFAYQVNILGSTNINAQLMANIDLSGTDYTNNVDEFLPWKPIGSNNNYVGRFNGNGKYIENLVLNSSSGIQGIFGNLGALAVIENVGLKSGKITGGGYSGGIVGKVVGNDVKILGCWNQVDITCASNCSGIVGANMAARLLIDGCWNEGAITGTGNDVGGIVGRVWESSSRMIIRNCYNTGKISASDFAGGMTGGVTGSGHSILNCYNTGTISGGSHKSAISPNWGYGNCYYLDGTLAGGTKLTESQLKSWGAAYALNGQKLSQGTDTGINWTYDKNISPYPYPVKAELPAAENWSIVGQALEDELLGSGNAVKKPSGNGESSQPYQISSAEQLAWFAYKVNTISETGARPNSNFCGDLTSDIASFVGTEYGGTELAPIPWVPIDQYGGAFGGNHERVYQLSKLYVNRPSAGGVFGTILGTGMVTRIGITDSSIISDAAGGIAAEVTTNGVLSQCYSRCTVSARGTAEAYVGGIVGKISRYGRVEDCYNMDSTIVSALTGSYRTSAGGIVGGIMGGSGSIRNCYSVGGTIRASNTGGTAGVGSIAGTTMPGIIKQCYTISPGIGNDSSNSVNMVSESEMKAQDVTDALNIPGGTEAELLSKSRIWYTSLAGEETKGYPTLTPPKLLSVELQPATTIAGTTGTLVAESDALPSEVLFRGIRFENRKAMGYDINLIAKSAFTEEWFRSCGLNNALSNLVLMAGGTDLAGVKDQASLTNPVQKLSSFSNMTLYHAASYLDTSDRVILLDVSNGTTRYEIRITVKSLSSKSLSLVFTVNPTITLQPGTKRRSESNDVTVTNANDYPLTGSITAVTKMTDGGKMELTPVLPTRPIDESRYLQEAGVILGITGAKQNPETVIGSKEYYYNPEAGAATPWISYQLGSGNSFRYCYFMKYSPLYAGEEKTFGYNITYTSSISTGDIPTATATVTGTEVAGDS